MTDSKIAICFVALIVGCSQPLFAQGSATSAGLPKTGTVTGSCAERNSVPGSPTKFTIPPSMTNKKAMARETNAKLLPLVRVDSTLVTFIWVLLNRKGRVEQTRLATGSGNTKLDSAVLTLPRKWKFTPAYNGREAVCLWMRLPVAAHR